jgi:hypothetical protein
MSLGNEELLHSEITIKLTSWAELNNVLPDHIVQSLIEDFTHEENLEIWAGMDPFEYLPQPAPHKGAQFFNWSKITATIRNVMVFLPVAITWEAVSKATEAFAKFVEANNATTVNFLEFWQNGYDVLPSFWTISNIASLDFAIILGVIALSLMSTYFASAGSRLNRSDLATIEQSRLEMALAIKMYLYSMREIDKNNVAEGVSASVSGLLSATTSLSKSSKALSGIISELQQGVPVIGNFGDRLGKETEKLVRQIGMLHQSLAGINTSVSGELQEAVSAATSGLDLANEQLIDSTNSIRSNSIAAEREIRSLQSLIKRATKSR